MLVQILLSREAFPSVPFAVGNCASELLLGTAVFSVNFALMSQQASRVCEALKFGTLSLWATVWTIVLVHVFAIEKSVRIDTIEDGYWLDSPPFALPVEILICALRSEVAIVFAIVSLGRITALDHALHLVPCIISPVW